MWAVDSHSVRKLQATYCICSIFQPKQIFAPAVANIAQRKSWRFEPTLIAQYHHSRHQTVTAQPAHRDTNTSTLSQRHALLINVTSEPEIAKN
jgi:hypothetical protein